MASYTVGKSRYMMTYTVTQSEKKQTNEKNTLKTKKSQCCCELQQSIFNGSHRWSKDYIL